MSQRDTRIRTAFASLSSTSKSHGHLAGSCIPMGRAAGEQIFLAESDDGAIHLLLQPAPKSLGGLSKVALRGVSFSLKDWIVAEKPKERFIDISLNQSDRKIFEEVFLAFAERILQDLEADPLPVYEVLSKSVARWKAFWASDTGVLTDQQIRGLLAELLFIGELIHEGVRKDKALASWTGPNAEKKDFRLEGIGIEVKSTLASPPSVTIQDLDQLDGRGLLSLYLHVRSFQEASDSQAISLEDGVRKIAAIFSEDELSTEIFFEKLARAGYSPKYAELYAAKKYREISAATYLVDENFPRLTSESFKGSLDARITIGTYSILIANIPAVALRDVLQTLS